MLGLRGWGEPQNCDKMDARVPFYVSFCASFLVAVLVVAPPAQAGKNAKFTVVQTLSFGTFFPGVGGGTLTLSTGGGITESGTVVSLGGEQVSQATVDSCVGSVTTLTVSGNSLTGPGAPSTNIPLTNVTCVGPGGTPGVGSCVYSGTAGVDVVTIGGTLTVAAEPGQLAGVYTRTYTLTGQHVPNC